MKRLSVALMMFLIGTSLAQADTKISAFTADTSPTSDDLIVTVNDPSGTPANRKVTLGNAMTLSGWTDGGATVAATTTSDNVAIGTTTASTKLQVAGTVTATAFAGDGSALTGLAAGWSDSGTNVILSTTTDLVGIGTTAPTSAFEVVAGSTTLIRSKNTATSSSTGGGAISLIHDDGAATDSGHRTGIINFAGAVNTAHLAVTGATISSLAAETFTTGPTAVGTHLLFSTAATGASSVTERMRINSEGNVGIGDTTPTKTLDVLTSQSGNAARITSSAASSTSSGPMLGLVNDDGAAQGSTHKLGTLAFGAALDASSTVNNSAAVTAYASEAWSGTAAGADMAFETVPNTTLTRTEKMRITEAGRVGIGTTSPIASLEVNGLVVPDKVTADPCSSGAPEGGMFYNDTSNYFCYCDGTNDVKMNDPGTACF